MREFVFLFLFCSFSILLTFSQESYRGVSISQDTLPPDPNSVLDVRSINKGVLLPRLSYCQLRQWQFLINGETVPKIDDGTYDGLIQECGWDEVAFETPIINTTDINTLSLRSQGMIVFVNSSNKSDEIDRIEDRGYYYWKNNSVSGKGEWLKLEEKKTQYPIGSIISYSGVVQGMFDSDGKGLQGTSFENWRICDGSGGTPDMSGRFVVGFSDESLRLVEGEGSGNNENELYSFDAHAVNSTAQYNTIGKQENVNDADFVFLDEESFPKHNHKPNSQVMDQLLVKEVQTTGDQVDFKDHVHPIKVSGENHSHEYEYTRKEKKNDNKRRSAFIGADKPDHATWKGRKSTKEEIQSSSEVVPITPGKANDISITINNVSDNKDVAGGVAHSRQEALDIRPSYYVVLFLIKYQ